MNLTGRVRPNDFIVYPSFWHAPHGPYTADHPLLTNSHSWPATLWSNYSKLYKNQIPLGTKYLSCLYIQLYLSVHNWEIIVFQC